MLPRERIKRFSISLALFRESQNAWFVKFSCSLTTDGLTLCIEDPNRLWKTISRVILEIEIYVDGILLADINETSLSTTKAYIHHRFVMSHLIDIMRHDNMQFHALILYILCTYFEKYN